MCNVDFHPQSSSNCVCYDISKNLQMEDDQTHVVISGPPASRTVIDNLKKLLTKRQHSRESDAENKEVVPSTGSDLESELSFYSLLTSSTSDSDSDFGRASPDNRKNKRRPKRNLSSSSSSSSSLSPVRERKKRPKIIKGAKRYDSEMIILEDWNSQIASKRTPGIGIARNSPISQLAESSDPLTNGSNIVNINIVVNPNLKYDDDPDNQSSSNKDSSDEDDPGFANLNKVNKNGIVRGTRLRKTRRDRNKRRKHRHVHRGKNKSIAQHHQLHVSTSVPSPSSDSKTGTHIPTTNTSNRSSPITQLQLQSADGKDTNDMCKNI